MRSISHNAAASTADCKSPAPGLLGSRIARHFRCLRRRYTNNRRLWLKNIHSCLLCLCIAQRRTSVPLVRRVFQSTATHQHHTLRTPNSRKLQLQDDAAPRSWKAISLCGLNRNWISCRNSASTYFSRHDLQWQISRRQERRILQCSAQIWYPTRCRPMIFAGYRVGRIFVFHGRKASKCAFDGKRRRNLSLTVLTVLSKNSRSKI